MDEYFSFTSSFNILDTGPWTVDIISHERTIDKIENKKYFKMKRFYNKLTKYPA